MFFTHFKFFGEDVEFHIQIGLKDGGIDHTISFHSNTPFQIFVGGGKNFKIIGPVVPGGSISLTSFFRKQFFDVRSEEHTSELQSRGHLVCRLLLEKKKEA